MSQRNLNVVAGKGGNREVVGTIVPREGMLTNKGVIARTTPTTLVLQGGSRVRINDEVTVRHTEALSYGYPHAQGCARTKVRNIKRGGRLVEA